MLAQLSKIGKQLASIVSVPEAKELRDKAEAIAHYNRSVSGCREIERQATVIRLRAERRIGELLAQSVKRGNPKVTRGDFSLPAGITKNQSSKWQAIAKLPQGKFEKLLEARNPTTKGAVKLAQEHSRTQRASKGPASGGNIYTGDLWQLNHRLEDGSVDLFLTDPPYADVPAYGRLAALAANKLKPGGLCLAYCGLYHLPQVLSLMGEHLTYHWLFSVENQGQHRAIHPRRIQNAWTPIVTFGKGKAAHSWVGDHLHSQNGENDRHEWQKAESELEYLISRLTEPGELVCDPFCGSGTTLAVARRLGRRWIGTELDATTAKGARRRVA